MLKQLTSICSKIIVKRKFKTAPALPNTKTKWWFIVSGDEAELQQLQQEWEPVATQTAWELQPPFFYPYETTPQLPQPALTQTPSNPQMARVMKLTLQMTPSRAL